MAGRLHDGPQQSPPLGIHTLGKPLPLCGLAQRPSANQEKGMGCRFHHQGTQKVETVYIKYKVVTSLLLADFSLTAFYEASCHIRKGQITRTREYPLANSQLETEALSSTALEKLKFFNNHISLKVDPSPVKFSDKTRTLFNTLIVLT